MIYTFDIPAMANISNKFANVKPAYAIKYDNDKHELRVESLSTNKRVYGTYTNYGKVYTFSHVKQGTHYRIRATEKELLDLLREETVSFPSIASVKTDTVREYMIGVRDYYDERGLFEGTYTKEAAQKQIETWTQINPTSVYFLLKVEGTAQYKSVPSVVWS